MGFSLSSLKKLLLLGNHGKLVLEKSKKGGFRMERRRGRRASLAAYSPRFARKYKKIILPVYRMISKPANFVKLEAGEAIEDKKIGIKIQKDRTGSYEGKEKIITLRVTVAKKEFFIKIIDGREVEQRLEAIMRTEKCLREAGHKFQGRNVRAINFHIAYEKFNMLGAYAATIFVTDFYKTGEVKLVKDMGQEEQMKLMPAIKELDKKLWGYRVIGVGTNNIFYQAKTDTLLLFDLKIVSPRLAR